MARRLDEFAEGLDEREIEILKGLLVSSMNPLERLRFLDQSELLTPREWEALRGSPGL